MTATEAQARVPVLRRVSDRKLDLSWKRQPVLESRHDVEPEKATMQMLA